MDWLKDKKNQPIVAGALAVIIVGAIAAMYFLYFAGGGSSETASTSSQAANTGMPGAPPPTGEMGGMPPTTPSASPAAPAPGGPAPGAVQEAAAPMEAFRADPFTPVGYKPPRIPKHKPKPPIKDLPFQNWSKVEPPDKGRLEPDLPQPVRRMAGLIVSDSIYAIIETNGISQVVQPGDVLTDRMAMVERIERDRIVLKTMDKKPKYLIVRMASAPRTDTSGAMGGSAPGERGSRTPGRGISPEPPPM